jgi:protein-S-isoprenylcysteine O-methyltransferase Ste14
MRPLLFDVPPLYGTIFTIVAALWALPELLGAVFLRSPAAAAKHDRGSYAIVIGGVGLGVLGALLSAMWFPQLAITIARPSLFWIGIVLSLAGIALRWYAIWSLGRAFTQDVATRADQALVQTGPYSAVRHPAYSATLLTMLGMGLALANIGSLVIILVGGLLGLLYRIRIEEQALLLAFGAAYHDYMQHTRRLIPFVW